MRRLRDIGRFVLFLLVAATAGAQEPFFMDSATHPSRGITTVRSLLLYRDTKAGDLGQVRLKLAHGIRSDLALLGEWGARTGEENGLEEAALRLKWRFLQRDVGPVNTIRASFLAGTEIPADTLERTEDGWNPLANVVATAILGRHGINASAGYRRITADDRDFNGETRIDASYLYRLHPRQYDMTTRASWYAVSEWNSRIRGESDYEVRWTPGFLYEAWRWAAELGVILPLAHETETINDTRWGIVAGLRSLF